jgi:hypothetical protein
MVIVLCRDLPTSVAPPAEGEGLTNKLMRYSGEIGGKDQGLQRIGQPGSCFSWRNVTSRYHHFTQAEFCSTVSPQ